MLIKFVKPDPRAGTTAKMDSHRGQQLIDAGSAVAISESAKSAPAVSPAATPAAPKATRRRASKAEPQATPQTGAVATAESDLVAAAASSAAGPGETAEGFDAENAADGTAAGPQAAADADTQPVA